MPRDLNRHTVKQHLDAFNLRTLFINELGWDHGGADAEATVDDRTFALHAIAHKRGMVVYRYVAEQNRPRTPHRVRHA